VAKSSKKTKKQKNKKTQSNHLFVSLLATLKLKYLTIKKSWWHWF